MKIISGLRQGDVYLAIVDKLPKGATKVVLPKGRIVLAYGEVTGHAHAIYEDTDQVQMWAEGKVKYLEVMATVMLKHEEHSEAKLIPGIYKLPMQMEYTPQALQRTQD